MSPPKRPLVKDTGADLWGKNSNPQPVDPLLIVVEKLLDNWRPAKIGNDIENMTSEVGCDYLFQEAREAVRQHEQKVAADAPQIRSTPFGSPIKATPWPEPPLTRRERYAMKAMHVVFPLYGDQMLKVGSIEEACVNCFAIADRMIKQGEKT